jgi:hypothetical protein
MVSVERYSEAVEPHFLSTSAVHLRLYTLEPSSGQLTSVIARLVLDAQGRQKGLACHESFYRGSSLVFYGETAWRGAREPGSCGRSTTDVCIHSNAFFPYNVRDDYQ